MRVIAVANQKGGQGKTTVTANLGVALGERGLKVLVVDADPQFALTRQLLGRAEADRVAMSLAEALANDVPLADVIVETGFAVSLVPASRTLASTEIGLVSTTKRELRLGRLLRQVERAYDIVLVDCPPNLGLLTVNALAAAHDVLVPVSAEDEGGVAGVGQVQMTLADLYADDDESALPTVSIVLTRWDRRMEVAQHVDKTLRDWPGVTFLEARTPDLNLHHKATPQATPAMLLPIKRPEQAAIAKSYRKLARELGLVTKEGRR